MKRTTSLFLYHLPYWHNLNPYSVSFEDLSLGESDDFSLFATCNRGGSYQASYLSFYVIIIQCPADLYQLSYTLALFHNEVAFLLIHRSRISRPLLQVFSLS